MFRELFGKPVKNGLTAFIDTNLGLFHNMQPEKSNTSNDGAGVIVPRRNKSTWSSDPAAWFRKKSKKVATMSTPCSRRTTAIFGALLISMFLLSFPSNSVLAASASPSTTTTNTTLQQSVSNFQLAVFSSAPKLPADGGQYPLLIQLQTARDGKPVEASNDVAITVLSSDGSIAVPQKEIAVVEAGQSMVPATIATTTKTGSVDITVIAAGMESGKVSIETINLGSLQPTKLALYTSASSFLPNPSFTGKMYVQLLNSGGIPAVTDRPLTIYLSSEDQKIGTVPKYVTIPQGSTGTSFDFVPTTVQGSTRVTASANGLSPGHVTVSTSGPVGTKLVIEFAPATIPAPVGFDSTFIVQIQDANNVPVLAKQQIIVSLTSSDTGVAKVPEEIIIEPGNSYATEKIKANGKVGSSTITASAPGLVSGFSEVNTVAHQEASDNSQKQINVYVIPTTIVPNNAEKAHVIVQVTDTIGNVYSSKSYLYYPIILSSSNANMGSLDKNLHADRTYAVTTFKSSFYQGTSTISASANGYTTGQAIAATKGFSPFALQVMQLPQVVLAGNNGGSGIGSSASASSSIVVSLFDEKGKPVVAQQQDILVSLSSSDPQIAQPALTTVIPVGRSYAQVQVNPTSTPGSTTITAQAAGLAPGSVAFKTVGNTGDSSQYKFGIFAVPRLPADGRTYESVFVQLRDANGNPVPASADTRIVLASSTNAAGSVEEAVTLKKGSSFAIAKFTPSTTATKYTIIASSPGFGTVETSQLETTVQPLVLSLSASLPSRAEFAEFPVAIDVFSGGLPVRDATVLVGGLAANTTSTTSDTAGHAESMYVPTQPGKNSVIFTVTKPGYEVKTATYGVFLETVVDVTVNARTEGGNMVPLQAKVSGPSGSKTLSVKTASGASVENVRWGSYKISVPAEFATPDAKYKFARWSDGVLHNPRTSDVISDSTFTAVYSAEYLVAVSSAKGEVSGAGAFYPEGQKAVISVYPATTGNLLIQSSFDGWTGSSLSKSPATEITMDGPKTLTAKWTDSYIGLMGLIGAAAAGGVVAYLKVIKPKKEAKAKERTPDLDWYKS